MTLSLFLALLFLATFIFGRFLEKIRVPWVFAALFLGLILSLNNPFTAITSSDTFVFLAKLGMYFLLFIIGFELNIREILRQGKFISQMTITMVISEALIGSVIIHYLFHIDWKIAILVGTSFATVGEAVLVPILDEFRIIRSKFAQTLLGIGTLDDIVELITIVVATIFIGRQAALSFSLWTDLALLVLLILVPFIVHAIKNRVHYFKFRGVSYLFLLTLFIIFAFVGVGQIIDAAALAAILAGIALRTLLNGEQSAHIEEIIRTMAYGFLVPIFFLWVGVEVDVKYLLTAPQMILLILVVTNLTKILSAYFLAGKKFGTRKSVLMGIGLSAKFSTSLVIITMLFNLHLIHSALYSTLIGAMAVSKFIIPVLFSTLIRKWGLQFEKS